MIRNENIHGFLQTIHTLLEAQQGMMNSSEYLKVFVSSVTFKNTDFRNMRDPNFRLCCSLK